MLYHKIFIMQIYFNPLTVIRNCIHPFLLFIMKVQRILRGQKMHILNEGPNCSRKSALYVINHSCRYDIPFACEIIGRRSNVLVGKQRLEFIDRLCFVLNGVIWVDRHSTIDKKKASHRMQELLLKNENVLMFPEATWNLEPSKPMLPMYWGCIDIARRASVPIVPLVLEYKGKDCYVKFGEPIYVKKTDEKTAKFEELSEVMATLRWEIWEKFSIVCRKEVDMREWELEKVSRIKAYPKLDYEYEVSCMRKKDY